MFKKWKCGLMVLPTAMILLMALALPWKPSSVRPQNSSVIGSEAKPIAVAVIRFGSCRFLVDENNSLRFIVQGQK